MFKVLLNRFIAIFTHFFVESHRKPWRMQKNHFITHDHAPKQFISGTVLTVKFTFIPISILRHKVDIAHVIFWGKYIKTHIRGYKLLCEKRLS